MTSQDWINVAKQAGEKIKAMPNIKEHEYEWTIYSKAKELALTHATACYAVDPDMYKQANQLELERVLES